MLRRAAALASLVLVLMAAAPPEPKPADLAVPGGEGGIGFDDLRFAPALSGILVPAGRTGMLHLLDAAAGRFTRSVQVGSTTKEYKGGHGEGVTSADAGGGRVYATDRTSQELVVVDMAAGRVTARAKLSASPDYVRFVPATGEVWVTEPDAEKIEVFSLREGKPVSVASIAVPGGPESLTCDAKRAYTHLWKGTAVAIDIAARTIGARWKNGCDGSRGIALDAASGLLFTGCAEGKVTSLDLATGRLVGSAPTGAGVDIIDYDSSRRHVYAPGGRAKTMTIVRVEKDGRLAALGTFPAAESAHCVASDGAGHAVVCDPNRGRLLLYADPFPRP
jgi:outer membrane protein assembly factor BamB